MPAIQNGTAQVTNGSTTVRHVWNLVVTGYTTIPPGTGITWSGGGVGIFVSYDSALARLKMYRTAGPDPVAGTVFVGDASGGATVLQYGPGTPGKWDLGTIGGTPVYFHRTGSGKAFIVSSLDDTDRLTLSAAYDDPTETDVGYGITQDYTANFAIPIVQLGDVDALTVLSLALVKIDQLILDLNKGRLYDLPNSNPGITGRLWYDPADNIVRRSP